MFDFITSPIETLFDWIQYGLIFGAFITTLIVVGVIVAIPIGLKMLGVYFAKTIVIETSKVLRDLEINKLSQHTKEITQDVRDKIRLIK